MLRIWLFGLLANMGLLSILNRRGEAGGKTFTQAEVDALISEKTAGAFTQDKVDAIVSERVMREKARFADYEDLKKFKTEHEKQLEAGKQAELEAKQEYEKLKEGWINKESEYSRVIAEKDASIKDMKISGALMSEIVKQNAYAEETMAMIKSQAVFDKEGNIRIKGRDTNGLEVLNSVEEGIKNFLTAKPHLVKVNQRAGGGTGAGVNTGAAMGAQDLNALNAELMQAQGRGDVKKVNELKIKVKAVLAAQRTQL